MSSINVSSNTKDLFDELQPDDMTQDAFVQELLETYQKDVDGIVIDPEAIAEQIAHDVNSKVELAAYRGIDDRLDQFEDDLTDAL